MAVLEAFGFATLTITATGSANASVTATGFSNLAITATGTASRTPSVIPLAKGSNLLTRGFGPAEGGGGTGGGKFTIYQAELLAVLRPTASFSMDMIVDPQIPAVTYSDYFSMDLVVNPARTLSYSADILVINEYNPGEGNDTNEEWNDTFI